MCGAPLKQMQYLLDGIFNFTIKCNKIKHGKFSNKRGVSGNNGHLMRAALTAPIFLFSPCSFSCAARLSPSWR
jgi:hypothetical protein